MRFYREALGWDPSAGEEGVIAFFDLNGTVLELFEREALAKDAGVSHEGSGFPGFTLAHNVRSENEVDELFDEVRKAGARILKEPKKTDWGGYSGYFADPDGYLWEVAYNPSWNFDEKGRVLLE